jgi:oligopeptide transport system substrate-binding protein
MRFYNRFSRQKVLISVAAGLLAWPVVTFGASATQNGTDKVFRLYMPNEPSSFDPARLNSADASYFYNNIMRGLYSYSNDEGLVPEDAKICRFETELKLVCSLDPKSRWSDGSQVLAEDYVRAFRHLTEPTSKNPGVENLKSVKNALDIHSGKIAPEKLGVRADGKLKLIIEFQERDPEFLYRLVSPLMVPIKSTTFVSRDQADQAIVNGPYRIRKWQNGKRVTLTANTYYAHRSEKDRPDVEVLFLDDDQTALNLYEKGELTFLRRLPTHYIAKYRLRPDFLQIPVSRFDYVGFGPDLKNQPDLRAALSYSADYKELQKIYDALGIPGCPGIPEQMMSEIPCVKFDLKKAREHWAKVPDEIKKQRFKFHFSKLGGDDVKEGAEWFQAQWKKNLGLKLDLEVLEQGVYLSELRNHPAPMFRKGVGLDRPTCLSALETFAPTGSENFIKFEDKAFVSILDTLERATSKNTDKQTKTNEESKRACSSGIKFLLDRNLFIPLGRIHFTLLARREFSGWKLNEMNQLDLARLKTGP